MQTMEAVDPEYRTISFPLRRAVVKLVDRDYNLDAVVDPSPPLPSREETL